MCSCTWGFAEPELNRNPIWHYKSLYDSLKAHNNVRLAAAHCYLENHFYKEWKWQYQTRCDSETEADLKPFDPDGRTERTVISESPPDAVHQTTSVNIKIGLLSVWSLSFVQTSPITHQPFALFIISTAPVVVMTSGLYGGGRSCQRSLT